MNAPSPSLRRRSIFPATRYIAVDFHSDPSLAARYVFLFLSSFSLFSLLFSFFLLFSSTLKHSPGKSKREKRENNEHLEPKTFTTNKQKLELT